MLNQKSYNAVSHLAYWVILPFFSMLSAFLLINNKDVQYSSDFMDEKMALRLGKFIIVFTFPLILLVCLNNFVNFWLPLSKHIELEKKKEQIVYKRALFVYILLMGYLIFFFNKASLFGAPISLIVLLVQGVFLIAVSLINPYRQSLTVHTVTLFINHGVYTVFLVVVNLVNSLESLDERIVLWTGYFITFSCCVVMVLTLVRLYYEYWYG